MTGAINNKLMPATGRANPVQVRCVTCHRTQEKPETLDNIVMNAVQGLDGETRKILRKEYPAIDLDRIWIVEHGRTPMSGNLALAMTVGGGLLLVGAFVLLIRKRRPKAAPDPLDALSRSKDEGGTLGGHRM